MRSSRGRIKSEKRRAENGQQVQRWADQAPIADARGNAKRWGSGEREMGKPRGRDVNTEMSAVWCRRLEWKYVRMIRRSGGLWVPGSRFQQKQMATPKSLIATIQKAGRRLTGK